MFICCSQIHIKLAIVRVYSSALSAFQWRGAGPLSISSNFPPFQAVPMHSNSPLAPTTEPCSFPLCLYAFAFFIVFLNLCIYLFYLQRTETEETGRERERECKLALTHSFTPQMPTMAGFGLGLKAGSPELNPRTQSFEPSCFPSGFAFS